MKALVDLNREVSSSDTDFDHSAIELRTYCNEPRLVPGGPVRRLLPCNVSGRPRYNGNLSQTGGADW